jgi:hypothetical protein
MTIIAAWKEDGIPFLLGDIMVSYIDNDNIYNHSELPTRDDLGEVLKKEDGVINGQPLQKIYVISDNFVVGWSGVMLNARKIITKIWNSYNSKQVSFEEIENTLSKFDRYKESSRAVCLIGWIFEKNNFICFKWDSASPYKLVTSNYFVEGSGKEIAKFELVTKELFSGSPIEKVISRSAAFLREEVLTGKNLQRRFGGGVEIITFNGERFYIIEPVTYIFMYLAETDVPENLSFFRPIRIITVSKYNDVLIYRAIIPDENSIETLNKEAKGEPDIKMFYVPSIYLKDRIQVEVPTNIKLQAKYYCFAVDLFLVKSLQIDKDTFAVLSFINSVSEENSKELIQLDDSGIIEHFVIKDKLLELLIGIVRKMTENKEIIVQNASKLKSI